MHTYLYLPMFAQSNGNSPMQAIKMNTLNYHNRDHCIKMLLRYIITEPNEFHNVHIHLSKEQTKLKL